ncbi:Acid protease [Mycena venus]|uniref:Acid protease n=1 Tax=Mycena venus TaxID=2733690 RepID=A0A8H6YRH2_9AGAR|nr:Acid protease [Mycena venus]
MSQIHSLPFTTRVHPNLKQITERDCKRVAHFQAGHQPHHGKKHGHKHAEPQHCGPSGSSTCIPVTNAGVTYLADVGFGSPATTCKLLIDTGSSNTWCLMPPYKTSSTSKDTRKKFSIKYGLGDCSGDLYTDRVTLGPKLVIEDQCIGAACEADDMNGLDGILGIGPCDLTQGTTADSTNIPTVTDNCVQQGLITKECIGIYYEPTRSNNEMTGSLSFGGPDKTKYIGELNYVPITKTKPACLYWGIEQSITYDGQEIMARGAGIADTGTTLVMLPKKTFEAYCCATGATLDQTTGLLTVTQEQYGRMKSMMFNIGGVQYALTKNAQIWPRSQNEQLGVPSDKICLIFASMGDMENPGLCFINGFTFLQRFYSVYDTTNNQVGFATTEHTMTETN